MEEKITFGKFVLKKRKELNMTQKELAVLLYVSESAVSKWERGLSYPDISLVSALCEALQVSEHELITSSEDYHQRELEKQANGFKKIVTTYSWIFYLAYGMTLGICLICNIAVNHTVSWFFIVAASILLAASLTLVPVRIKKHKAAWTLGSFFVSLNLLLLVCCLYTNGDWFLVAFTALLFSASVIFLPFVLKMEVFSSIVKDHKALICIAADSILLLLLIFVSMMYSNLLADFIPKAVPLTIFLLTLPWLILISIRYIKANPYIKTSICLFCSSVYIFVLNSVVETIVNKQPFQWVLFNLRQWNEPNLNGNVIVTTTLCILGLSVLFVIVGVIDNLRNKKSETL